MRETALSQKARFGLLLIETSLLCLTSRLAFGRLLPPTGDKGFWFYTALLGLILGSRLDTPFFARPADVFLYAAPAAIALALVNSWSTWGSGERVAFAVALGFCTLVGLLGAVAIMTKEKKGAQPARASDTARILAEKLGTPQVLYTGVVAFSLYAFHRESVREVGLITAVWALTAMRSPFEAAFYVFNRLRRIWRREPIIEVDGEVIAYQTPRVILIRQNFGSKITAGDIVAIHDPLGGTMVALALDHVGRDEGILLRTIDIMDAQAPAEIQNAVAPLPPNSAVRITRDLQKFIDSKLLELKNTLIGIVAPDTSLEKLFFEVVRGDGLEEGRLVEVSIGNRTVTYQIVNGLTKEEIVQHKNTYGYVRAQAQKIGEWDSSTNRFRFARWLPEANSPVFIRAEEKFVPKVEAVGHFPGTNYTTFIKNMDELVTHNTAILGILGVGKSTLAIELTERMMFAGIKVICLDLTNQYATELVDFYDEEYEKDRLHAIQEAGQRDRDAWAENPADGGSVSGLTQAIINDLSTFLDPTNPRRLKIYNPATLCGTKQVSEPRSFQAAGNWQRRAALWTITPVEVTRIITESALQLLQDKMSDKARVCVIFEEAHSLVPEMNAVASETDRAASNGTARAILQGRKFGLGCLLVTQRTANVTKTILNQCNTVFAMRTFDDTGKAFLANYIGSDYASSLSSIPERYAVLFGKASSCENPVLIRLNERDEFKHVFRDHNPPPELPRETPEPPAIDINEFPF
jgi:hypothetical protein